MQKTTPTLYVCLDTNVLYISDKSESAALDNFFPPRVSNVIRDERHAALNIRWVVPEMVRHERQYQMFQAAKPVIGLVKKMPRLFADSWLSKPDDLEKHIAALADNDLREHGVQVIGFNKNLVDWDALCVAAGLRKSPFDPDASKEKGFKDAIVAETFSQFCSLVLGNTTDTAIFVSGDAMLQRHVAQITAAKHRVKVLPSIDELTNELNVLASDIPEEIAAQLPPLAQSLLSAAPGCNEFWKISQEQIAMFHASAFTVYPGVIDVKEMGRSFTAPVFLEKKSTRVYFKCNLDIPRMGRRWVLDPVSYMNALAAHAAAPGPWDARGPWSAEPGPWSASEVTAQPPELGGVALGHANAPVSPGNPAWWSNLVPGAPGSEPVGGHWEDTALPLISFGITWSADYSLNKEGDAPIISNPHFEELHPPIGFI